MPPATTFTVEMLTAAACAVVEADGIEALSARSVAARLSCSTAPIYSSFGSVEELRAAVIARVEERLREYTRRTWTDRPFLNQGAGVVMFARDYPQLFRLLFLTREVAAETVPRVHGALLADMRSDPRFTDFTAAERKQVLEPLWFIAVGMATLAYSGQLREATSEAIASSLLSAGSVLIPDAVAKLEKPRRR